LGICEVVIQRKTVRSKWVKMLRLHLSPAVDSKFQAGDTSDAMDVFTASLQGSLDLQLAHSASTLKVFGRTAEQLRFLTSIARHLNHQIKSAPEIPVKIGIDGRFLSIVVV
jgi:hypothetical protein